MKNFNECSNEELAILYQETMDEQVLDLLFFRLHEVITQSGAKLFLMGADREDLIQEGRMGLFFAVKNYDPKKNDSFVPFAKLCILRAQMKAVESYNRKKYSPLNTSFSLDVDEEEGPKITKDTKVSNPEEIMIDVYETEKILEKIEKNLSPNEMNVLVCLIDGYDYKQIAKILDKDVKSIDNAMQRIRKKVFSIVKEKDNE